MTSKRLGNLIIGALRKRISGYQVVSLNIMVSGLVFLFGQKELSTWPMLDLIGYFKKLDGVGENYLSNDYLINSQIENSGRGPFIRVSYWISDLFNLSAEMYLALGTAILIVSGPTIVLLSLIMTRKKTVSREFHFTFLGALGLCSLQYFLFHYAPRLSLAGYSSYRFTQGIVAETLGIFLTGLAILIFSFNNSQRTVIVGQTLLALGLIIHPTASGMYIVLWVAMKLIHNNSVGIGRILAPLMVAIVFEVSILQGSAKKLTGFEFTQIYAEFRHPHHFWPSYFYSSIFLEYFLIALAIVIFIRLICSLGKPFRDSTLLLVYVSAIWVLQWLLVEKQHILLFAQLSITRGFVFIGFAFCVFFFWIMQDIFERVIISKNLEDDQFATASSGISKAITMLLVLVSLITVNLIADKSKSNFNELKIKTENQISELGIAKGETILVDIDKVDSSGWREYGYVSIWLDSYFPFDLDGVALYRDRWLKFCGYNPIQHCNFVTNTFDDVEFRSFLIKNQIDVVVLPLHDSNLSPHHLVQTGRSDNYLAYRVVPE